MALFGEGRGAEAYVPLPDGRSIPVSVKGGGNEERGVTNNYHATLNVHGVTDADSFRRSRGQILAQMENGLATRRGRS